MSEFIFWDFISDQMIFQDLLILKEGILEKNQKNVEFFFSENVICVL